MDPDERIEMVQTAQGELWEDQLNRAYRSGRLCEWVSTFHHGSPCRLASRDLVYGSYNAGFKLIFDDGTVWLLRFPRAGKVHGSFADEKVAMEVAAIDTIRRKTIIPVPKIEAWGVAAENPLGLGPFILMEFIQEGVSLNDLLKDVKSGTRLLREDVSDVELEIIHKHFAGFLLQLFKLDFDHIGSLDSTAPKLRFPVRPLTWKAHDILQTGGVDTFGMAPLVPSVYPSDRIIRRRQGYDVLVNN